MLGLTRPKLVICEANNLCYVREAINQLKLNSLVFIFDESQDGARSVDELLVKTDREEEFM